VIETYHLSKLYRRGVYALRDLSLTVDKGEFLFLTGRAERASRRFSGFCCVEGSPERGRLSVSGRNLSELTSSQVQSYRRSVGFVFQDFR
jgi:cell division transport system ATP-binding protein